MTARVRWHARWVLPINGAPIPDGTVVTDGDRIAWVGPRTAAPSTDAREEELGDAILMPGLVNAHTHLDLTLLRGLVHERDFFDWVRAVVALRNAHRDDELFDAAQLGVADGLRAGITTFGDTAPGDHSLRALAVLGARGIAYREVFGPDPAQCESSVEALRAQVESARALETALVRVGVSPHAPYSVSDDLFRAVAAFAEGAGLPVAVHIAESREERRLVEFGDGPFADFLRGRGIAVAPRAADPIALLDAKGLLLPSTLLIHCVRTDADAARRIASAGCGVAHCPASNARLDVGVAPLDVWLREGVRVGLGSDSLASNDAMDILGEASLAIAAQRERVGADRAPDARTALRLATLGGAAAMRMEREVGSLEPGKAADLAVFPIPVDAEPEAYLVSGATLRARRVVVAGIERVRDGAVIGLDADLAPRTKAAAERIRKWRVAERDG